MSLNIVEKIDDQVKIHNIIISVSDKTGLEKFVPALLAIDPTLLIYSTGGTYKSLQTILGDKAKMHLVSVADYTGQPEMQGGLVKTLDFAIYLGLLSESYNPEHYRDLERTGAVKIDMVVVNLYPFKQTVAKKGVKAEEARTNIDIGGPCMVRASAKNYLRVASVTDPADYDKVLAEMRKSEGRISFNTRFSLAQKAFKHTAEYDAAIAKYLNGISHDEARSCYRV